MAGSLATDLYYQANKNYSIIDTEYIYKEIINNKYIYIDSDNNIWSEFECSGYSLNDNQQGTNSITYTGIDLSNHNFNVVAVDPNIIPLYSIIEIQGMGAYVCIDIGEAITGNKIDILFDNKNDAINFGKQNRLVRVIK
jgi:3D (Asp-Asp-Asp) domain-containing protein